MFHSYKQTEQSENKKFVVELTMRTLDHSNQLELDKTERNLTSNVLSYVPSTF